MTTNITLLEIAEMFGKDAKFGEYFYNVGRINNEKITELSSAFAKSSREVIDQFSKHGGK